MTSQKIVQLILLLILIATVAKASPRRAHTSKSETESNENGSKSSETDSSSTATPSVFDVIGKLKDLNLPDIFRGFLSDEMIQAGCFICNYGVSYLKRYVLSGADEDDVAELANSVCNMLSIHKPEVCYGYTETYKHVVTLILKQSNITAEEFCTMALEGCSGSEPFKWTVPINSLFKPRMESPKPPKKGAPTMRVLHISDVHLDPQYVEGSNAKCGLPLCCRQTSGKPATEADKAGYWGDYRQCDLPLRTLKNMLSHINETHEIDYVMWTGDISPHDTWSNTKQAVISEMRTVSNVFSEYFKHIPIFPALGNHESWPQNSYPPLGMEGQNSVSWVFDELGSFWPKWLPDTSTSSIRREGYYSVLVQPGFRIISLNMNYCNKLNFWLLLNSTDPTNQLAWFADQLQKAEDNDEKVHILGHIPPGNFDCLGVWSENYNKIINRYENTVTAQFFGHTHNDEFEIFFDKSGPTPRPINIAYIAPPVTPAYRNNPSYRIFTVEGDYPGSSRAVLDYDTYFLNLTEANMRNKSPKWTIAYSAKCTYEMKSLLPEEWSSLTDRFEKNNELFQKFYRFYTTQMDNKPCNQLCKKKLLCRLKRSQSNDPPAC